MQPGPATQLEAVPKASHLFGGDTRSSCAIPLRPVRLHPTVIIDAILEVAARNSVDARAAVTAVRVSPPRGKRKRVGVGQLTAAHGVGASGGRCGFEWCVGAPES